MKVLAVAMTVFKYGLGTIIGFVLVCLAIYLFFIVLGLIFALMRRRKHKADAQALDAKVREIGVPRQPPVVHYHRRNEL